MTPTVPERKTKRADDLVPGDWTGENHSINFQGLGPCEVLFVKPYTTDLGDERVHLVVAEVGFPGPQTVKAEASEPVRLLTEAELAEIREHGKRARLIADIRVFADFLESNPWLPMPNSFDATVHLDERHIGGPTVADAYARVHEIAERLGAKAEERLDDRTAVRHSFGGRLSYEAIAWHPSGRPAEPQPEPVGEHYPSGGVASGGSDNEAWCACGTTFAGFDTHADATAELDRHIADPLGLSFTRDDLGEADDPRPVSPAREPMHVGVREVDGGELVDETPAEPVTVYFSFGHGQTDPVTGKALVDHYVTIIGPSHQACRKAMFASKYGHRWAFDYLKGDPESDKWIARWTEHERIVMDVAEPDEPLHYRGFDDHNQVACGVSIDDIDSFTTRPGSATCPACRAAMAPVVDPTGRGRESDPDWVAGFGPVPGSDLIDESR